MVFFLGGECFLRFLIGVQRVFLGCLRLLLKVFHVFLVSEHCQVVTVGDL